MMAGEMVRGWQWRVTGDYESGSALAAEWLVSTLRAKPDLILCAATGQSPSRAYDLFTRLLLAQRELPNQLRVVKLDEWGGLPMDNPATCEFYLQEKLVRPLRLNADRFIGFQSDPPSPLEECRRVEAWLQANGPIDVCVLGLGINGHLGFNEPGESLAAGCHVAHLTEETLSHSMLSVTNQHPSHGLTLGMRDILASRSILLLVFGAAKAAQLNRLFSGGVSSKFPASFLLLHQKVTCVCDSAAVAQLNGSDLS